MRLDPSVWPTKQKCATVGNNISNVTKIANAVACHFEVPYERWSNVSSHKSLRMTSDGLMAQCKHRLATTGEQCRVEAAADSVFSGETGEGCCFASRQD